MGTVLHPMMGYPFTLDVTVDYRLDNDGLTVRTTAINIGDESCPYGAGHHPYLSVGTDLINPCTLQLDASRYLPTDERGLPTGRLDVEGSAFDFRTGRIIGDQDIDFTFTGLGRDQDGLAWVRRTGPDGMRVAIWADENYPFIELYTSHTQPPPYFRTRSWRGTDDLCTERFPHRRGTHPARARREEQRQLGYYSVRSVTLQRPSGLHLAGNQFLPADGGVAHDTPRGRGVCSASISSPAPGPRPAGRSLPWARRRSARTSVGSSYPVHRYCTR